MGKIIFWFVVIVAVLFAARLLARGGRSAPPAGKLGKGGASAGSNNDTANMSHAEAMVRCEHCGIHLPRSEAFLSNGKTWCGPEHARIGQSLP